MKGEERVEQSGLRRAGKGAGQQKSGKARQSAREDLVHRGRLTGFPRYVVLLPNSNPDTCQPTESTTKKITNLRNCELFSVGTILT